MRRFFRVSIVTFAIGLAPVSSSSAQIGMSTGLPDFATLVKINSPAVVNISTDQLIKREELPGGIDPKDVPEGSPFDDFLKKFLEEQPSRDAKSLGSGFIISDDGYIMTSAHVIEDAKRIIVRLSDRREREATVVGLDRKSDVAVLKIEADDLATVTIGSPGDLAVGEWVLAIGSPFGFESSATAGIVSAKGRSLPNENYVPFIQTDVAINPGNSGGPLFNLKGEVVGVNAQIYSRTGGFMGLSFAVPIDLAMRIANQLTTEGHVTRGWLGVAIQEVSPEMAEELGMLVPRGALITEILGDGPAANSELQKGDVVVAFNDIPIENMAQLPPVVGQTEVGSIASVEVVRDSEPMTLNLKIGELPTDDQVASALARPGSGSEAEADEKVPDSDVSRPDAESGTDSAADDDPPPASSPLNTPPASSPLNVPERDDLGMKLEPVEPGDRLALDIQYGLRVMEVASGPAMRAGVREGDVLLALNGQSFDGFDHFTSLIAGRPNGASSALKVLRGEQPLFLVLK